MRLIGGVILHCNRYCIVAHRHTHPPTLNLPTCIQTNFSPLKLRLHLHCYRAAVLLDTRVSISTLHAVSTHPLVLSFDLPTLFYIDRYLPPWMREGQGKERDPVEDQFYWTRPPAWVTTATISGSTEICV